VVMYVIYISVLFYRYANHVFISYIVRVNHRDECELPPTMCMPPICDKGFSFGEEWIGSTCCHGIESSYCIITKNIENLLTKRNPKLA
jgi:hypothetical protein